MEAIRLVRRELDGKMPLIGFAGAPFTLASYIVEGGHSKNYVLTKGMMYQNRGGLARLDGKARGRADPIPERTNSGGAQALQMFDSWVGCLSPQDYEDYVLPYSKKVIDAR